MKLETLKTIGHFLEKGITLSSKLQVTFRGTAAKMPKIQRPEKGNKGRMLKLR
jgi:hypothetical protein